MKNFDILNASKNGNAIALQKALKSNCNINMRSNNHVSALETAIHGCHQHIVKILCDDPRLIVNSESVNTAFLTCMHFDVDIKKMEEIIKMLLNHKSSKIELYSEQTLLYACVCDMPMVLHLLLKKGFDCNHRFDKDLCPLSFACAINLHKNVEVLLRCPDININFASVGGVTPLITTTYTKSTECIELLLKRPEIDIHQSAINGHHALSCAFVSNNHECMKKLIAAGSSCLNWKNWPNLPLPDNYQPSSIKLNKTLKIMINWRSYLPEWSPFIHKRIYPQEFEDLAINCMMLWNRIEQMHFLRICKDIKRYLLVFVAKNWRNKI